MRKNGAIVDDKNSQAFLTNKSLNQVYSCNYRYDQKTIITGEESIVFPARDFYRKHPGNN